MSECGIVNCTQEATTTVSIELDDSWKRMVNRDHVDLPVCAAHAAEAEGEMHPGDYTFGFSDER